MKFQKIYIFEPDKFKMVYKSTRFNSDHVLDLRGSGWVDVKYGLFKVLSGTHRVSVWDTDLPAHDDYINYSPYIVVFLVFSGSGASKKRLRNAYKKLHSKGIKLKYFASSESFEKYSMKEAS